MNAAPSTTKLLGLGTCLLVLTACAAEASSPAPKDDDSNGNNNGNTGGKTLGTGGNTGSPGSGVGNPGTGGTGTNGNGTAGSNANNGTSGSAPSGSAGTGGAAPGGSLAACPSPPAAGALADVVIDDVEDGDNGISKVGGRSGFWYTFGDALGTMITPNPDPAGTVPLVPGKTDCHGASKGCIVVSGSVAMNDEANLKYAYAGVGFDFSNAKKPCLYNGGAYSGIKFWARGDAEITVKVNIPATADAKGGGTCAADCGNAHGLKVILTSAWTEYNLPFATIMPDPTWGPMPAPAFDKANLLSVQVQFPPGSTFSAALDDFTFY